MPYEFGPLDDPKRYLLVEEQGVFHGASKVPGLSRRPLQVLTFLVQNAGRSYTGPMLVEKLGVDVTRADQFGKDNVGFIKTALGDGVIETDERTFGWKFAWWVGPKNPQAHISGLPGGPRGVLRDLRVPEGMLPRRAAVQKLKRALLREKEPPQRTMLTATAGQGGIGKTVLASLAMNDPEVQARFPDGVIGLMIGLNPPEIRLESEIRQIPSALGESPSGWERNTAYERIERLLQGKRVLLVLDDVWDINDIGWVPRNLGESAILITTRDEELSTAIKGTVLVNADLLEPDEAVQLLADRAGVEVGALPKEADEILFHCGRLAIAVSMAGAMVEGGRAWRAVTKLFARSRIDEVGAPQEYQKHKTVFDVLHASVEYLSNRDRERYLACSVFPDDARIPEAAFEVLWDDEAYASHLTKLKKRFLLTWENGAVTFHDLQTDYLRCRETKELRRRHGQLLERYKKRCLGGWSTGPNDGYFFEHLIDHLEQAGSNEQARALMHQLAWLEAKLEYTDTNSLLADFRGQDVDKPLALAVRQAAHILDRNPKCLWQQLLARVREYPDVKELLAACRQKPGLQPLWVSLEANPALLRTLEGHWLGVNALATTPCSKMVLSASSDKTLILWDLEGGKVLRTLTGHFDRVNDVKITKDGNHCVSASDDKTLKVWDLRSGIVLNTLKGHSEAVSALAITDDGKRAISASWDLTMKFWDLESGECLRTLSDDLKHITSVGVTPEQKQVVSAYWDGTLKVWDLENGECLRTLKDDLVSVASLVVTPDGKRTISGFQDGTVKVCDLESGETLCSLEDCIPGATSCMALMPDGYGVVYANALGTLMGWHLESGEILCRDHIHLRGFLLLRAVAVTPDRRRAITAYQDGTLDVWKLGSEALHDSSTDILSGPACAVAVTPDGSRAVAGYWSLAPKVWDMESGECLHELYSHDSSVVTVAVTPDGKQALSGSPDQTLKVWDLRNGECLCTLEGHSGAITSVVVTPDGKRAVSASNDRTVKVWDLECRRELITLEGHLDPVTGVAVTPDGKQVISASVDNTLRIWDLERGRVLRTLYCHSPVNAVVAMPDGDRAVSLSLDDTLTVWDLKSGKAVETFEGDWGDINALAVTPDGALLVSGSLDGTVRVLKLNSGIVIAAFECGLPVNCCVSVDNHRFAVGDDAGRLHYLLLKN